MRCLCLILLSLVWARPSAAFLPASSPNALGRAIPHASHRLYVSMMPPSTGSKTGEGEEDDDLLPQQRMPANTKAPVTAITSSQELMDFLEQDDRLCIVKFHAAWCKSCQKFGMKFQSLANKHGDWVDNGQQQVEVVRPGPLRLASIEFGANTELCRSLGIKRLPTVHFYKKGEKMAGFPCGPKKFPMLQEAVEQYLASNQQELKLEEALATGDTLMGSRDVSTVLQDLAKQEEVSHAGGKRKNGKRKWWNFTP